MKRTPLKRKTRLKKKNPNSTASKKRKETRKDYPEFFKKHIGIIRNNNIRCRECGEKLIGDVSEVAHVLDKQGYPEIATEDDNVIYLCSWKSPLNCHSLFDGTNKQLQGMGVFNTTRQVVINLINKFNIQLGIKMSDKWKL